MSNLMIVDDHALVRKGIILLLENYQDVQVVAESGDGHKALKLAAKHEPDIVLLDISMPQGLDGFATAKQLIQQQPDIKIILLTMHDEEVYIRKAIQTGAHGYILKKSKGSDLYEAIYEVYHGRKFYKVHISDEQLQKMFNKEKEPSSILTLREQEIVRLTVLGYTNKEIAQKLNISIKTVENHKSNIMHKLNLRSKHELIQYGINNHYIDG